MKKLKIVSILIILSITIYCGLYFLQYKNIKNYQINYWFPPKGKVINDFKIIRCGDTLFNPKSVFQDPKIAFISDQLVLGEYPELTIYFSKMKNTIIGKIEENYLGATDVKNTTFPELVKMVKEDCGQFQQAKGDFHDETINWSYSKYTPEPPKEPDPYADWTEEELAILEAHKRQVREEQLRNNSLGKEFLAE